MGVARADLWGEQGGKHTVRSMISMGIYYTQLFGLKKLCVINHPARS